MKLDGKLRICSKKHNKHRLPQASVPPSLPVPSFQFTVKDYDEDILKIRTRRCITELMQAAALSNYWDFFVC